MYLCMHIFVHPCTYIQGVYVCVSMHPCIHAPMYSCTYLLMYSCIYALVYLRVYVDVYLSIYIHVSTCYICIYIIYCFSIRIYFYIYFYYLYLLLISGVCMHSHLALYRARPLVIATFILPRSSGSFHSAAISFFLIFLFISVQQIVNVTSQNFFSMK